MSLLLLMMRVKMAIIIIAVFISRHMLNSLNSSLLNSTQTHVTVYHGRLLYVYVPIDP